MTNWISKWLITLAPLVAIAPSGAHAQDRDNLEMRRQAGTGLSWFARDIHTIDRGKAGVTGMAVADCRATIDSYAAYVKPSELIVSTEFALYPGKDGGATQFGDSLEWQIPFKRAKEICDTYERKIDVYRATRDFVGCPDLTWHEIGDPSSYPITEPRLWIYFGESCLEKVKAAVAAGVPDDLTIAFDDRTRGTLAEVRAAAEAYLASARLAQAAVVAAHEAAQAKIVAHYKKAGIKGARLELFVSYGMPADGGWYGRGCDREITTVQGLKKAKKLFHWLTRSSGEIVVRKYTFKGDKYSVAERAFWLPENAHAWCK
jgi:hypothetical protein